MKAKIKFGPNAGREIDVVKFDDWNYRNVKSDHLYGEDELDFSTVAVDWSSFRREAAKDILAGMLSNPEKISIRGERLATIEGFVNAAIEITDELIRQIKEK